MKNRFLGSLGIMLTGAGLAFSQVPYGYAPPPQPYAAGYGYYNPGYGYGYGYAPGYGMNYYPGAMPSPGTMPVNGAQSNPTIQQTAALVPARTMNLPGGAPEAIPMMPTESAPASPMAQVPTSTQAMPPAQPAYAEAGHELAHHEGVLDHDDGHSYGHVDGVAHAAPPQFWCTGEYLLWWFKEAPISTPILTSGDVALAGASAGAIGAPGTSVVSPSQLNFNNPSSGGRLELGAWLNADRTFGIEGNGFVLQRQSSSFLMSSPQGAGTTQILGIPFFNLTTNAEDVIQISDPLFNPASISIVDRLFLWGAECNALSQLYCNSWFSLGILGGFRYLDLSETLDFNVASNSSPASIFPNDFFHSTDHFATRNQFFGGQVGGRAEVRVSRIFANVTGKVAVGPMYESVTANGTSTSSVGNGAVVTTLPVGVLVQTSNTGKRSQNEIAVVPEVQVQLGVQLWRRFRLYGGYDFLYVSNVLRPGDQIDRSFNTANLPVGFLGALPPASTALPAAFSQPFRPSLPLNTSNFWAQGVNVGLEVRY